MNWLRKILGIGKKDREKVELDPSEVKIEHLNKWLDEKTSSLVAETEKEISKIYVKIKETLGKTKEAAVGLEKVNIEEKKVGGKLRYVAESNRDLYVNQINVFVRNIRIPEKTDFLTARSFYLLLVKELDKLAKNSARSAHLTSSLIGEELALVLTELRNLSSSLNELKDSISNERIDSLNRAKESAKELRESLIERDRIEGEKKGLIFRQGELNEEEETTQKKIDELEKGEEFQELEKFNTRLEELKKELGGVDFEIRSIFGPLQKSLQKFAQMQERKETETLLKGYAEESIKMLKEDEGLKIIDLLQKLRESLQEGRIELKEKKQRPALRVLNELKEGDLREIVKKRGHVESEIEGLKQIILSVSILKRIDDLKKRLAELDDLKGELTKDLRKINLRIEKIPIEEQKKKVIAGAELATKSKIILVITGKE